MLSQADVAFEFTNPHSAYENVVQCLEAGVPVVCGTTGWNDRINEAESICREKKGAFFYASNFSIGVNIFFDINKRLSQLMNQFPEYNEVWLTETHHTEKKDMPSGTAITIAGDIVQNISRIKSWKNYNANKIMGEKEEGDKSVLAVNSLRVAGVAGIHEVDYDSEDDSIQIIHQAKSRKGFAKGAMMAGEWLVGKKGVFGMKDLLQL
jgi:4-hydroxy-tetrahydrodipicolinate reductase